MEEEEDPMWTRRVPLLLCALTLVLATPSSVSVAVQKEFYEHRGSDNATFDSLRQHITTEENRRREDISELRGELGNLRYEQGRQGVRLDSIEWWKNAILWVVASIFIGVTITAIGGILSAQRAKNALLLLRELHGKYQSSEGEGRSERE